MKIIRIDENNDVVHFHIKDNNDTDLTLTLCFFIVFILFAMKTFSDLVSIKNLLFSGFIFLCFIFFGCRFIFVKRLKSIELDYKNSTIIFNYLKCKKKKPVQQLKSSDIKNIELCISHGKIPVSIIEIFLNKKTIVLHFDVEVKSNWFSPTKEAHDPNSILFFNVLSDFIKR